MTLVHVKVEHWSPGGAPFSERLSVAARTSLMDGSKGPEVVLSLIDKGGEHEIIMPYREGVELLANLDAVLRGMGRSTASNAHTGAKLK